MIPGTIPGMAGELYDPYWDNVVLMLNPGGGADAGTTFTDLSDSGHTITPSGDTQWDDAQLLSGRNSILFDGTGDYLSVNDHADFEFGSGDFTLEAWVNLDDVTDSAVIFTKADSTSDWASFQLRVLGGEFRFAMSSTGSSFFIDQTFGSISTDTDTHVAVIRDGTTFYGAVNGTVTTIGTSLSNSQVDSSLNLRIGGHTNGHYLDGHIGGVRFTKGAARWTSNFTPPPPPWPTK